MCGPGTTPQHHPVIAPHKESRYKYPSLYSECYLVPLQCLLINDPVKHDCTKMPHSHQNAPQPGPFRMKGWAENRGCHRFSYVKCYRLSVCVCVKLTGIPVDDLHACPSVSGATVLDAAGEYSGLTNTKAHLCLCA